MGSGTDHHKIPIINFSEETLKPGSDSWILATKQGRHGLEEYGYFEVAYDKFLLQLHNSIFGAAKDLFYPLKRPKCKKRVIDLEHYAMCHHIPQMLSLKVLFMKLLG